jgi:Nucleoside 2-deoxyribosyltransferase like
MIEIKAPNPLLGRITPSLFLAGSIEMGSATEWQKNVVDALKNTRLTILNPRREQWNAGWEQSIHNPQFVEQVVWELKAMERADRILMYFDPATKSPISLLEMGLHAREGKLLVVCPEGFWRKGNVDVTCRHYGIDIVESLERAIDIIALSV